MALLMFLLPTTADRLKNFLQNVIDADVDEESHLDLLQLFTESCLLVNMSSLGRENCVRYTDDELWCTLQ